MVRQVGHFHPEFVNYLVLATGVYSLPLALLRVRHMFQQQRLLLTALLTPLFWLAIPRPNSAVLNLPVKTLGFLDIVLTRAFGDHKTIPYFLLWLLGCLILQEVIQIERHEPQKLLLFAIIGFFAMNLFTYMVWDKYLLMVLPLIFLSLAKGHAKSRSSLVLGTSSKCLPIGAPR
jgi:heme exporter protein D